MLTLDKKENGKLISWLETHDNTCPYAVNQGAIGGRLTYMVTPTSLGTLLSVKCTCGESTSLNDGEDF